MITHKNLDNRICDCEECENTQTYREYIMESEDRFWLEHEDINNFTDKQLQEHLEFLDYLWYK